MECQEKIRRIIEFMNIPEFDQIMSAKLLELEMALKPQIAHYCELKERFKKMTIAELDLVGSSSGSNRPQSYYFDLKRVENPGLLARNNWVVGEIKPERGEQLVPAIEEFAVEIGHKGTGADRIESKEFFSTQTQKYYDVFFLRYSDNYIFGTISEKRKRIESASIGEPGDMINMDLKYRNKRKEDSYHELIRYLDAYPELRERLMAYFYIVEKPQADSTPGKRGENGKSILNLPGGVPR